MKHSSLFILLLNFIILISIQDLAAQKDTIFWFVAPEITKGNYSYDSPIVLRISSYDTPVEVKISMPANPNFSTIIVNLPTAGSEIIDLTDFVEILENKPPNQVLNKGLLIESTGYITVYYEVIGQTQANPEIYALKGQNALGNEFYIPIQNIISNSTAYSPLPHAAFDIVATEHNTEVTITPTRALVGHAANITFSIILNRGESYCAEALSQAAGQHPTGSHIISNKPVAITIKDDLLESGSYFGGTCRDQIGDQIIPVIQTGRRYILQKGLLNSDEKAIVIGTKAGTSVSKNGINVGIVGAGESMVLDISIGSYFIEATEPVYVLQISGNACEVGGEVIPSLDCSGSKSVRFVRTNDSDFVLFVVTSAGNQDAFLVNGNAATLGPTFFQSVSGSNGEFVAAAVSYPSTSIIPGISTEVINTKGKFHLGFINGGTTTGCNFGFFSDFLNKVTIQDTVNICIGDTVQFYGVPISAAGHYQATISPGVADDCDTLVYITALTKGKIFTSETLLFCEGSSVVINGIEYTQPGTVLDTLPSSSLEGCDTILTIFLVWAPLIQKTKTIKFCPGTSFKYNDKIYTSPTTIVDTIPAFTGNCDTLLTINLILETPPSLLQTLPICVGESLIVNGYLLTEPGIIYDTIPATVGCDTILTIKVQWADLPRVTQTLEICPGDSILINGVYYSSGQVVDTIAVPEKCDTVMLYNITYVPHQAINLLPDVSIYCPGEPLSFQSPYSGTVWNKSITETNFTVSATGIVTVSFFDEYNCPHKDTVLVKSCCNENTIFVPNAFSPDSEPPNHQFRPYSKEPCTNYKLSLYDRWGALLFSTNDPDQGWDGTFRNKKCEAGVYIWILEVAQVGQNKSERLKGDVTLIR